MPYVYAHTRRGFLDLIKQIDHYAAKSDKGKEATIETIIGIGITENSAYINLEKSLIISGNL